MTVYKNRRRCVLNVIIYGKPKETAEAAQALRALDEAGIEFLEESSLWIALKKGQWLLQSHLHRKHLFLSSFAALILSSVCNRAEISQE